MAYTLAESVNSTFSSTNQTSKAATFTGAVAAGDLIIVTTTYGDSGSQTDVVTDSLGNTYSLAKRVTNATSGQGFAIYYSVVTNAGTATVTQKYNPTPGTSTNADVGLRIQRWTGTTASSAIDGNNGQAQNAPGTGTDALTSTAFSTATDGDLVFGASLDASNDNNLTAGTGYTDGGTFDGGAGNLLWRTFYQTQSTHGSISATATATAGTDNFVTIGFAITPSSSAPATVTSQRSFLRRRIGEYQ